MDPKFTLVSEIYQQKTEDGHEQLAELLLNFFTVHSRQSELVSWVIRQEVKNATSAGTLFREESVLKQLIFLTWRNNGGFRFLKATVKPFILELKSACSAHSLEVKNTLYIYNYKC